MRLVTRSRIAGGFRGWEGSGIYVLANGQVWKQIHHHQDQSAFALDPEAKVWQDGPNFFLEVAGMPDRIAVQPLTGEVAQEAGQQLVLEL